MNRKHILSLFMTFTLIVTSLFISPPDNKVMANAFGDYQYTINNDNTAKITKYIGSESNITIPKQLENFLVTSIGNDCFSENLKIKTINLPNSIESIGDYAFSDCSNLYSINIPESVVSIGKAAFFSCVDLSNINFPNSLQSIGDGAFFECLSLKNVHIKSNTTQLGEYIFSECKGLKEVIIDEGITTINHQMFTNCINLLSVKLPNSLKEIGRRAFSNCYELTDLSIPDGVQTIGSYCFNSCYSIKHINFPCEDLEESTFSNISNKANITFTNKLKEINKNAFSNLDISEITIPSSVSFIDDDAFVNSNIKSINLDKNNSSFIIDDNILYNKDKTILVTVANNKDTLTHYNIPDGIIKISSNAFLNCDQLCNISFPNTLKVIDDNAFKNCYNLSDVIFPDSLESIGNSAFSSCESITELNISKNVKKIGDFAFSGNGNLFTVFIPKSIAEMGNSVFYNCEVLSSVNIENGIKSLGEFTFDRCNNIFEIYIPESVSQISGTVFSGAKHLSYIDLDDKNQYYTVIDNALFSKNKETLVYYYNNFDNVEYTVPKGTKNILPYGITNEYLKTIYLPDTIECLGDYSIGYSRSDNNSLENANNYKIISNNNPCILEYASKNTIGIFDKDINYSEKNITLNIGQTLDFNMSHANKELVTYSSSNSNIAYVNDDGIITTMYGGKATIIANTGTTNVVCRITVIGPKNITGTDILLGYTHVSKDNLNNWENNYYSYNNNNKFLQKENKSIFCYSTNQYTYIVAMQLGGHYLEDTIKDLGQDYKQYQMYSDNLSKELSRYHLHENTILYSGKSNVDKFTSKTSSLKDMKASIGNNITYQGVISTSLLEDVTERYAQGINSTTLEIYAPKDHTNGAYIYKLSNYPEEYEYLLDKNITYKIIGAGLREYSTTDYLGETSTTIKRYMQLQIVYDKPIEPESTTQITTKEPTTKDSTTNQTTISTTTHNNKLTTMNSSTEVVTKEENINTKETSNLTTKHTESNVPTGDNHLWIYYVMILLMSGGYLFMHIRNKQY